MPTLDALVESAHDKHYQQLPRGKTFKDLSTVIVTPVRGQVAERREIECPHCGMMGEQEVAVTNGIAMPVVRSWERMIRPMNQPITTLDASGYEVGDAYESAVQTILEGDYTKNFQYVLFLEDDVVVPWMPNTKGPLWQLYERIADGYDVANGLYWTKGLHAMPLIFGDPEKGTDNFEAITDGWEPGDVVECNGAGMGFSLWKLDIFRDKRFKRPWFKTMQTVGEGVMTQDLYAYKKIRELGYRVCVDTGIRCGHYSAHDQEIY